MLCSECVSNVVNVCRQCFLRSVIVKRNVDSMWNDVIVGDMNSSDQFQLFSCLTTYFFVAKGIYNLSLFLAKLF